jgi:hypothetical protein
MAMVVCAGASGVSSRDAHDAVPSAPVPAQGLAVQGGVGGCDLTRALQVSTAITSGPVRRDTRPAALPSAFLAPQSTRLLSRLEPQSCRHVNRVATMVPE